MAKFNEQGFLIELEKNEVFVFGSNLQGFHAGGAARRAYEHFVTTGMLQKVSR